MKIKLFIIPLCLAFFSVGLVNGCKKDSSNIPSTDIGTKVSFTEEFENVYQLESKGWVFIDNSSGNTALWSQGMNGNDKSGNWYGFSAYSYLTSRDEYAYCPVSSSTTNYTISSWLITPVLSVKNGDKISFYTRADTTGAYKERMQVRMNKSAASDVGRYANSVGGFTTILFDINATQATNGYPTTWTKYEYTFSGISGKTDTRIGFMHYVTSTTNARGIGIDQFRFQVN